MTPMNGTPMTPPKPHTVGIGFVVWDTRTGRRCQMARLVNLEEAKQEIVGLGGAIAREWAILGEEAMDAVLDIARVRPGE